VASRAMLGQKDARGAKANDDDAGKGTLRMILSVMGGGGIRRTRINLCNDVSLAVIIGQEISASR